MKIKEITVGKSGVIPNAPYANYRPAYSMTIEIDENDGEDVEKAILEAKKIVNRHFELDEYQAKVDLLKKQFKDIKFYDAPNGLKYPSISSILGYDKEWSVSKGELLQYGSIGTIIHAIFWDCLKNYQKTKEIVWRNPQELGNLDKELGIVANGSLGLNWEDYSYKEFGQVYIPKIEEVLGIEQTILNHEIRTAGTYDLVAIFDGKLSLIDLKSGSYDWRQLAFYARTWEKINQRAIQQMVVFPVGRTDNKSGYQKPIIETNIDRYWDEMLEKREQFKNDFGI